jgi:hypothetical protein
VSSCKLKSNIYILNNNTAYEFSYSCANSTAWTSTPPPPVNIGKSLYENRSGGNQQLEVTGTRNKTSCSSESLKEMMEEKEEKDGFQVQLQSRI